MGRWLLLSSSLIVLGALYTIDASSSTARAPDARTLGGTCDSTRDCRNRMQCVENVGVLDGQCSAACADTSACQQAFGVQALCLGADLCARACAGDGTCPNGTICNAYGWCERATH